MLSGDRRGASVRRGMTVLGRIPAVPKPINLPSQRLENRGLDPNVEIVPRGGVSWGSAGRSPPTINNAWGAGTQASSPPLANGTWGNTQKQASAVSSSGVAWGGIAQSRPSSAGSGTRPSSAGSVGQMQESQTTANAWGPLLPSRPSTASATSRVTSGSVVQGQSQGPIHGQPPARPRFDERPRSAEARPAQTSRLGESPSFSSASAWGGQGADSKTARESHQPTAFQLTRVDFPTLGSEKSPDLRPQQGTANMERASDDKVFSGHQRPPPNLSVHFEEMPRAAVVNFGAPERPGMDSWHRDPPFGPLPGAEGNWHREDHRHMASHDGHPPVVESWRRDSGHDVSPGASPSDESWRRGGPLVGPHGPHGPGRFAHDTSGFPPQQRYGPGPGPYGRGGPSAYGHHVGDVYGNPGLLARQGALAGRPGPLLGPGIYPGPVPYDGSYAGPPMEERGMMMVGMGMNGPGVYVGFQNRQGPPPDMFGRYPHGSIGSGSRVPSNSSRGMREHAELPGVEGDHQEIGAHKDARPNIIQDSVGNRRLSSGPFDAMRPGSQGGSMGQHHGLRDWGASASEEPMDFSKPVFEEDATPGQNSSEKPVGVVSVLGNDMEREKKSNGVDRDIPFLDDIKPRERHDDHKDGGKFSGRSGRKPGNQTVNTWHMGETTQEGPRVHRPKEGARDGALENEGDTLKKDNRRITGSTEKGSFDVSRKDASSISAAKDRPGSKDSPLVAQRSHSGKHEDGALAAAGVVGRPGQQTVSGRPSGSGHGSHVAALVSETGPMHSPDVETGSATVVPTADATTVLAEEKTKGIKHSNSGMRNSVCSETGSNSDALVPNAGVLSSKDHPIKEESVHKTKAAHDAEKEWRPKAANAESKVDVSSGSLNQTAKGSTGSIIAPALAPAAPITGSEKVESEADPSTADSYDYEAQVSVGLEGRVVSVSAKRFQGCPVKKQRAKMKEIAHQRSLQLQKEEEERIKEQKAKAFAKLEELNRRAAGASASDSSTVEDFPKDLAEGDGKRETDTSDILPPDASTSNDPVRNISTLGGGRNGKNEHGKRERGDRKGRSEKYQGGPVDLGSRELPKLRVSTSVNHVRTEAPLLPSPSEQSAPVQSQPPSGGSLRGSSQDVRPLPNRVPLQPAQAAGKMQNARHRGKQVVMHYKHSGKQSDAGEETDDLSEAVPEKSEPGGWSGVAISGESHITDLNCVPANNSSTRKKRNSRNAKSKQRTEGSDGSTQVVLSSEHSDAGESLDNAKASSQDLASVESRSDSVKDLRFQAGGIEFGDIDLSKDVLGIQSVSPRSNGDTSSRRPQRKVQALKRPRERGVQDVRIGDKSHMTEGLIWAPVRSPVNTSVTGTKTPAEEAGSWTGSTEKGSASSATVSMSGKNAEVDSLELGLKSQQDTSSQVSGHQSTSQKLSHQQASDGSPRVFTGGAQQQGHLPTDQRVETDSKHSDKSLRAHASWRQRGSGNERGSAGKSYPAQYQTGSRDGTFGNHHPDSRGSAGKANSHVPRHEESSAHGQGDPGLRHQELDVQNNQALSHPPTRMQAQVTEQLPVQRLVTSEQQAKQALSHSKFDGKVVKQDHHVATQLEEGNKGSRFAQQLSASSDKEQQSSGIVAPPQPGTANKVQGALHTNGSELQNEHGRPHTEHGKGYHRGGGSHGERRPTFTSERQAQRSSGNQGFRAPAMPDNSGRGAHHQGRPSGSHMNKARVYPSAPEAEKSVHVERAGGHGDQVTRERERTTRERDQQHAKVQPASTKSGGQGSQPFMHGGNDGASGQNVPFQVGRLQQAPVPPHEREHSGHGPQQQFRPVPNSSRHEKDQSRDVSQHQRPPSGQTQWQQTSHDKLQPQLSESRSGHHGSAAGRKNFNSSSDLEQQLDTVKPHKQPLQSTNDHQSSQSQTCSQGSGHQKAGQERRPPQTIPGPQKHSAEMNSHWAGESQFSRGRDHGHRRGRVVTRGGATGGVKPGAEVETKTEQAGPKRMVIDATGGAVPNLVAG